MKFKKKHLIFCRLSNVDYPGLFLFRISGSNIKDPRALGSLEAPPDGLFISTYPFSCRFIYILQGLCGFVKCKNYDSFLAIHQPTPNIYQLCVRIFM